MSEPDSLAWSARFIASANRALDGDIYSWELKERTDPLQWVLIVTLVRPWRAKEIPLFRAQLKAWASANNAKYKRSSYEGRKFTALILLRGLGPKLDRSPYE